VYKLTNPYIRFFSLISAVFLLWFNQKDSQQPTGAFSPAPADVKPSSESSIMSGTCAGTYGIRYREIEKGTYNGHAYTKFGAFDCDGRGSGTVTVERWAKIVADKGPGDDLINILKSCQYGGYFFETKGVSSQTAGNKSFEFVLVDSPALKRFCEASPDPAAFREHLDRLPKTAMSCVFPNLGRDALLIAPRKIPSSSVTDVTYSHLAAFVRGAPRQQVADLLQMSAREYYRLLTEGSRTVWLSTSGLGVAWLHFRLDERPKYYQYRPFAHRT
jgi:hypothetical protein